MEINILHILIWFIGVLIIFYYSPKNKQHITIPIAIMYTGALFAVFNMIESIRTTIIYFIFKL